MGKIRIAILGAGNLGTAMAHALAGNGHDIRLWDFFPEVVEDISKNRINGRFLPGIRLHENIHATADHIECVTGAELVIVCVPSAFVIPSFTPVIPFLAENAIILNAAKGFAPGSPEPMPVKLATLAPDHPVAHLAGPILANELARGMAAACEIASGKEGTSRRVAEWFDGPSFMPIVTTDVVGAAFGGILKNIYAILIGYLGKQSGDSRNLEAATAIACIREMAAISIACGAEEKTLYGIAGLGDLIATGFSQSSHNRKFGQMLGNGLSLSELEEQLGWLPEGARSTATVCSLAQEKHIHAPLAGFVQQLLNGEGLSSSDFLGVLRLESSRHGNPNPCHAIP